MLYTGQYRYSGKDRIDITVKGGDIVGKLFAPTWDMVQGHKAGSVTSEEYTHRYYELLIDRWKNDYCDFRATVVRLVDMATGTVVMPERDLTLVCFCAANAFCHRHLLVKWLQHNWPQTKYGGER